MPVIETHNTPKKTPDSAATEPGAMTHNTEANGSTFELTLPSSVSTGKGEPQLSAPTVQDAAKAYLQKGLCPIPIPYKQKGPRLPNWQHTRLRLEDLPNYFLGKPQNIGIILGEPSGGLIDIDLDALEAIELADAFLPPTGWVFGRSSKLRSHRLYISHPIPEMRQFATNEGQMLVELRSTGGQTVFPPSIHESGEPIVFDQQGELARVSADEIQENVARLAAAALLVRHWPKKGKRQDTAMALAGGLARAGWEKSDIEHFIFEIAKAAKDTEAKQRINSVDRTEKRTQADDPVTGWPRLSQLIGGQVVDLVRRWLMAEGTAKDRIQAIRTGKGKESEKQRKISAIVMEELRDSGVFYITPYEHYYFDQLDCRLLSLTDAEFRARINDRFDINGSEPSWRFVLEDIKTEAMLRGQETTIYRFAYYEAGSLYVYKGQDQVFQITADGWSVVPNGTDGILFLNPDMEGVELPSDEGIAESIDWVLSLPNFDGSGNLTPNQETKLYRLWFYGLFFESLLPTKPILLLLGIKGSGKSMGLRAVLRILFGKKAQVLELSKDKEDAFLAAVTSQHLVALDNVDGEIKWLPNHLATAATGNDVPLRKLYTTNELGRYPVRCFLALTSREPESMSRDDVADRLLALKVERFEQFTAESQFLAKLDATRPQFWTELLQNLQRIVATLETAKSFPSAHRLADFASLAMNIGPVLGIPLEEVRLLLAGMDSEKTDFALEHNILFPILEYWMKRGGMLDREWIDTSTLFTEMQNAYYGPSFPCKNAGALSRQLKNLKNDLKGWFEIIGPQKRPGGNNRSYWRILPGSKLELTIQISDEQQ